MWKQRSKSLRGFLLVAIVLWPLGCSVQQDRIDARSVASRIHSQLQAKDFLSIYRESGKSFKEVGDEPAFVARMKQFCDENGSLKRATSVAYKAVIDSDVGRRHVLIFDLEFERGRAKEHLTLTRSDDEQLRLWDLSIEPLP